MVKNKIFKFLFIYLTFTIILSIVSFIYAILIKKEILFISYPSFKNITFIIGIILFFILGLLSGIISKKNGLLEGFLAALIILSIALLINLIIKIQLNHMFFIKVFSFLLSSMTGGVIGVNLTNKKIKS